MSHRKQGYRSPKGAYDAAVPHAGHVTTIRIYRIGSEYIALLGDEARPSAGRFEKAVNKRDGSWPAYH